MSHRKTNFFKKAWVRLRQLGRHPLRLAGFTLSLLILLTLFLLFTRGLPDYFTQKIIDRVQKKGLSLQIDSIRLSPRGWVLHNVRLYSPSPDDLQPLLKTEYLTLSLWPDNWLKLSKTGWNISVYGKKIDLSAGPVWENTLRADNPFRTLSRLHASLHTERERFQIEDADLSWGELRIHLKGQAVLSGSRAPLSLPDIRIRATRLANELAKLHFETDPDIDIHFNVDSNAPEKNRITATGLAEGILWKKRTYRQLRTELTATPKELTLDLLHITQPNGARLHITGSLDLETRIAQLNLENSLAAGDLLNLLPEQLRGDLIRAELDLFGPAEFNAALGPSPLDKILEHIQIDVQNVQLTRKDLTLDPLTFELRRDGDRLTVEKIKAHANEGMLTGRFEMDIPSRKWKTALHTSGANPVPVGTLVGPGLQMWIQRASFTNQQPEVSVNLSYGGTQGSLRMDGTFSAQNISCTGGPLDTLQVGMAYSNRVLTLAPLHAAYENKQFDGTVQVDFAEKIAQFTITTNNFSPKAIARVLAPDHPSFLEKLTFSGPIQSSGTGKIDYGTWAEHTVHATFRTEQVSLNTLRADSFTSRIDCIGTQLAFTNTSIGFCDGFAEGSANFDILLRDGSAPYRIKARAESIDFKKLFAQISTNDHSQIAGVLSGNIQITADAKTDFWTSAQGGGSLSIEEGQLANLPLLGGFTHLIQTAIPGFSLFSITTLSADYTLADGKLQSRKVQLGGTLLSAQAKGTYSPAEGLDVRLRAVPLRNTREDKKWYQLHLWSAEALKKATSPLFNLLEFELKGSLQDPQWRMKALPKEIYDIIHRGENPEESAPQP